MTMLSFRVANDDAEEARRWAARLGVDRSELLREALHRHLVALRSAHEVDVWQAAPLAPAERALESIADWGPAEDWSEWRDAAG